MTGSLKRQKKPEVRLVPRFLRMHKARTGRYWNWSEHINADTEMVLICNGQIRNVIENKQFIVSAGDFYFVQPNQLHYEEILSDYADYYLLRFDLLDSAGSSVGFVPDDLSKKQYLRDFKGRSIELFEHILKLVWQERPQAGIEVEKMILQLVDLVKEEYLKKESLRKADKFTQARNPLVEKATTYINQDLYSNLSVTRLAEHCCVTPSHLSHVFKDAMGISPLKYHLQLRMSRAKHLLADDSLCVYQIAHQIGYEDEYYFSRLFKKVTGLSPLQFRNHLKSVQL